MRFSKKELDLLRSKFGNNEEGLISLRNFLLQLEEKPDLSTEVVDVLEKVILPDLIADVPIGQQADLYFALGSIAQLTPDVAYVHIGARKLAILYLRERLDILKGVKSEETLKLKNFKESAEDEAMVMRGMLAYQFLAGAHIESCMVQLRTLAKPEETEEEKKKRLAKDSSK